MNFNEKAAKGWEKKDFESTENITGSIQAMKDTTRVIQDNEFLDFGYVMALILYELGTSENIVILRRNFSRQYNLQSKVDFPTCRQ